MNSTSKQPVSQPQDGGLEMSKPRSKVWLALIIFLFAILAFVVGGFLWYQKSISAKDRSATPDLFTIRQGDTADKIAFQLHDEGYIRSELAFRIALRLSGKAAAIKAGQYRISAAEDVHTILAKLESGEADVTTIQVTPGEMLSEIRQAFIDVGFAAAAVDAALKKDYDHPLLAAKPEGASLEGYIYPDTYEVELAQGPEVVLEKSFDNFLAKLEAEQITPSSFSSAGLDFHEAIILGSIVEKEVNLASDRPKVAQVFLKRLAIDMPLGSDATFVYAAKLLGIPPAVDLDSPYNTRIVKGLPPGPIASITVEALTAVAKPSKTNYLYFVTGDDNVTHFAKTIEEHNQNVENYCGVRCEL